MKNWRENKVVKKIYELRTEYEQRHLLAGLTLGWNDVETMITCDGCGAPAWQLETFYHKDKESNKTINLCPNCANLFRVLPEKKEND